MSGIASRGNWWDKVQLYANTANHMLIGIVSFYTTRMFLIVGPTPFSLHAWLCTIGYNCLMCEAIMALYNRNSWSDMHGRRSRSHLHWILQAIGCSLAFAGMFILYYERGFQISSIHSQLGLGSNILIFIGIINGSSALWTAELRRIFKPVYIKLLHNLTGSLCFTLGMAALIYGFQLGPFRNNSTPGTVLTMQAMCGISIVLSMIGALRSLCTQIIGSFPKIFESFQKEKPFEGEEEYEQRQAQDKA